MVRHHTTKAERIVIGNIDEGAKRVIDVVAEYGRSIMSAAYEMHAEGGDAAPVSFTTIITAPAVGKSRIVATSIQFPVPAIVAGKMRTQDEMVAIANELAMLLYLHHRRKSVGMDTDPIDSAIASNPIEVEGNARQQDGPRVDVAEDGTRTVVDLLEDRADGDGDA